jgi:hypothetical protein
MLAAEGIGWVNNGAIPATHDIVAPDRRDHPGCAEKSASMRRRLLDSFAALLLHRKMSEPPRIAARKSIERAAREAKLAKALRENLVRRKEQKRAQDRPAVRQSEETDPESEPPA